MPDLPRGKHLHYAGIDPGWSGAIGVMNAAGTHVQVWDMPTHWAGKESSYKELDLHELRDILRRLRALPDCVVGLENPTTRPGEGAERSARFGRQLGALEAMLFCLRIPYYRVAPHLWKGRLGLPGKTHPDAARQAGLLFDSFYPRWSSLVRGPREALRDGRCDALLVAHFLRTRTLDALRETVKQFGPESAQAMTLAFKHSRGRSRKNPGV